MLDSEMKMFLFFLPKENRQRKREIKNMTKHIFNPDYHDCYEYHGNTTIELTRKQGEMTIWRDWITFDTVEEAADYFNERCSAYEYAGF
jgi:hypothetical protein